MRVYSISTVMTAKTPKIMERQSEEGIETVGDVTVMMIARQAETA